eukprot:759986-Hanusia_phi.AAC.3
MGSKKEPLTPGPVQRPTNQQTNQQRNKQTHTHTHTQVHIHIRPIQQHASDSSVETLKACRGWMGEDSPPFLEPAGGQRRTEIKTKSANEHPGGEGGRRGRRERWARLCGRGGQGNLTGPTGTTELLMCS